MRQAVREQCLCNDVNIWSRGVAQGGYKVKQHSIIIDALGGWSQEMDTTVKEIVESRSKRVLKGMQKAVMSATDVRGDWLLPNDFFLTYLRPRLDCFSYDNGYTYVYSSVKLH